MVRRPIDRTIVYRIISIIGKIQHLLKWISVKAVIVPLYRIDNVLAILAGQKQ